MKFFTVFSALLVSGSTLAAYVPHGHTAVGLSQGSAELASRDAGLQARAEEKSDNNDSQGLINPLDALFDELKDAAIEENDATGTLERRNVLNNVLGSVVDVIGPDAPDFNKIVSHGFNVTATYVASVDLNALASEGIEWVSKKISSYPNIPGASIIVSCISGVKKLVGKVNLNTQAQSYLAIIGRFVTSIDFNSAIAKAIEFFKSIYSSMQSA
ncbi:hypothetical protein BKA59DRAFT_515979 [Fusarium tricinctum]|uniref:Uncharacterized protein n=2 Tax=Fusarium tricinctum species complex TaxID=679429 RepID=A0A8K0RPE9_9HYPO|nr:hypothetical protein BKA59DRAFT_515979 [Fusarium tricinctum]